MATYVISQSELNRRKRRLFLGLIYGGILGLLMYGKDQDSIMIPIIVGLVFGGFMVFVNWRQNKEFFTWAPNHRMEIDGDKMLLRDLGTTITIDIDSIKRVYVNMDRNKIKSVVIVRTGSLKGQLAPYSDLNGLVEELKAILGENRVEYKKWVHV